MTAGCCVCGKERIENSNRIFHKFPASEELRKKWYLAIGVEKMYKTAVVCSDHFRSEDYRTFTSRPLLKADAVPYVNKTSNNESTSSVNNACNATSAIFQSDPNDLQSNGSTLQISNSDNIECNTDNQCSETANDIYNLDNYVFNSDEIEIEHNFDETLSVPHHEDHSPSNSDIEKSNKRKIDVDEECTKLTKKLRCQLSSFGVIRKDDFACQKAWQRFVQFMACTKSTVLQLVKKNERIQKKVNSLHDVVSTLKKQKLITDSAAKTLENSLSPAIQELLQAVLRNRKLKDFPEDLRIFASTLHFYSPSAYLYVRKMFINILPHPATIRKWLGSVNNEPGLLNQVFDSISNMCQSAKKEGKQLYFNLVIDEMSIKKHVDKELCGYVDVGIKNLDRDDSLPMATNAIVFMLVCINSYFKSPVAFYFINSLTGQEKSNILMDILWKCHEHEIDVRNVTFDGASSNVEMVQQRGACINADNRKFFFHHPATSTPITVTLDACHMLKLIRNALAEKKQFTDIEGNIIEWKYINLLVELQENEGLHAATKVRRRHIHFENEKMKVRLAAQVFSTSVSKALECFEEDYKLPQFKGASATSRFCQIINDAFDLQNSRNIYSKNSSQEAITVKNLKIIKNRAQEYIAYIEALKINDEPVVISRRRTGFLGFIGNLNSLIMLAENLFAGKYMTFLLSYKLSQDHLETFFSCIRRLNGFNNNPTVVQFKAALRKLLAHANISISLSSNCIPKDDTITLSIDAPQEKYEESLIDSNFVWNVEHDYCYKVGALSSEYVEDVIAYISGFIVRSIRTKIKCHLCINSLTTDESLSKLQLRKCRTGKLIKASTDVVKICTVAERIFRSWKNSLQTKNAVKKMTHQTLIILPVNELFSSSEHAFDQAPLCDHRNQLIRLILEKFFNLRLNHEATSLNDKVNRIRAKHTKIILFKNQ